MRGDREEQSLALVTDLIKQQFGDIEVSQSTNQYAHYDLYLNYKGNDVFFEVKERMNQYVELNKFIKYSNEGWQMEMVKYNFLLGKLSRYINLFRVAGEVIIMTWDINKIEKTHKSLHCPQNTEFGGDNNYYYKQSLLLKPNQGTIYILVNGVYETITFEDLIYKLYNK